MTSNGRHPQNIKSNHLLDHTKIVNLSLNDQTIFYKSFKQKQLVMEDDQQILRVEYFSNHGMDHTH